MSLLILQPKFVDKINCYCYDAALPLKAEDVERLLKVKKEHYRVWKTIGAELGIDVDTLSAIEKNHTDDKGCLHAVINSANPAPTHETMAKVFQSANINNAIAGKSCGLIQTLFKSPSFLV